MPIPNYRYRVTRQTLHNSSNTLRDVIAPLGRSQTPEHSGEYPVLHRDDPPTTQVQRFAEPSRSCTDESSPMLEIAPPGVLVERRTFGRHELVIEHRGDEVSIVLPGALRLVGSRADAHQLIAALGAR